MLLLLDHYRLYWLIENRELPAVSAGISLRRGEVCYGVSDADWYQLRTNTKKPIRSGPSLRARIMEGVGWRPRAASPQQITDDQMKRIDAGQVFLTNNRLIFQSKAKNISMPLKKIAGFTPYANGIEVQREAGRNTFLKLPADVDLFALTLERVLRDAE